MAEVEDLKGPKPEWIEGHRYEKGERVTFRRKVWVAQHYTELRPGLGRAWLVEN